MVLAWPKARDLNGLLAACAIQSPYSNFIWLIYTAGLVLDLVPPWYIVPCTHGQSPQTCMRATLRILLSGSGTQNSLRNHGSKSLSMDEVTLTVKSDTYVINSYFEYRTDDCVCVWIFQMSYGGHGYSHILVNVVHQMLDHGLTRGLIDKFLVHNPKEWLSFCLP